MLSKNIPVQEGLKAMKVRKHNRFVIREIPVNFTATHKTFIEKGTKCDVCGVEADHWEMKLEKATHSITMELFANRGGRIVKMTRDHSVPRCLGGTNNAKNLVTMCQVCNCEWKSKIDMELKEKVAGMSLDQRHYLTIV